MARRVEKIQTFGLTAEPAKEVNVPMIAECHANFECRLADDTLVDRYSFLVFGIVKAHVAKSLKHPQTLHFTGDGVFMVAGRIISRRKRFRPERLDG